MTADLFETIKREVCLGDHIARTAPQCTITSAGSVQRIQPCPHCGHKDCCTLYPDNNSYACFSCDAGGDVINYERRINGRTSNKEAAAALAEQYHIDIHQPKNTATSAPPSADGSNQAQEHETKNPPRIPAERAYQLRADAARIYHEALLANTEALRYQIETRRHSLDMLKKHQVGHGTKSDIPELRKLGYTLEDLYAVGLLFKASAAKSGYRNAIPADMYVYPHFCAGNILHFTIKDPNKNKQFQLKKHGADPDWVCYGQDDLAAGGTIWIVEGEDDRLTLLEHGGAESVIATNGNLNASRLMDHLAKTASGDGRRRFYCCFDPDDAGAKYTKKIPRTIANSGDIAYVVDLTGHQQDIDEILRAAEDPPKAVQDLLRNHTTQVRTHDGDGDKNNQDDTGENYEFGSFDVLGELADGSIAFWSNTFRRLYRIPIKEFNLDQLCQIGGEEVRGRVSRTLVENMIQFKSLKTWLIVKAAHNYLGNLTSLGQGVHLLKDDNLLIVNGDEATIYNPDKNQFTRQNHPILDRQFLHWDSNLRWIETDALENMVMNMTQQQALNILSRTLELVSQWRFAGKQDVFMVTGWFLAQIVQAAWVWRPQLWLSGTSGSGKSRLTLLLEALAGQLARRFEGNVLTEPGLRQTLQSHTYMITIDEFEESTHRDKIIERLRSAGHGGKGAIGSTQQEAIVYNLRHMIMVASIETGLIRAAEQYRYLQISTIKDNSCQPTIPNPAECEELQLQIVAYALWAVGRAKQLIHHLPAIPGYDNRWIASIAVPLSMIAAAEEKDPDGSLFDLMNQYVADWNQRQAGAGETTDEMALIEDILVAKIRISEEQETATDSRTIYTERTVAQLLAERPLPPNYDQSLQAHGIRLREEDFSLFVNPDVINRTLLRGTRWAKLNIRDIITRAPGAMRVRRYIAGTQIRGVQLPAATWQGEE